MNKTFRHRACAVVVHEGKVLAVRLEDPTSGAVVMTPPGGAIDPGETPAATARRETLEETGYEVEIDPASVIVARYDYVWDGVMYECETHFFRGHLKGPWTPPGPVADATYHRGALWLEKRDAERAFVFGTEVKDAISRLL